MAEVATPNTILTIYTAIADGLEADPIFFGASGYVQTLNIIRYDEVGGIQTPEKQTLGDGDYPQAALYGPIAGQSDLRTGDTTFQTYDLSGPSDNGVEVMSLTYRLRITSRLYDAQGYTAQTMEAINAIRRLGVRLGVPAVTRVLLGWKEVEGQTDEDGMRRIITTIDIAVRTEQYTSTLTGGN